VIETKPWYQSKTIWGAIIAMIAPMLALLTHNGVHILPADQDQLADLLSGAGTTFGGILAILGRASARTQIASTPIPPTVVIKGLVLLIACAAVSGCAQYRQAAEAGANVALQDVKAIDDDEALAISIAPQAIRLGAFARMPAGAQKCAVATLAGIDLNGCTVTPAQINDIVSAQLTQHIGPKP